MTRWTVAAPTALDFDDVTELSVRLIGGTVAVLASDDRLLSPGGTASHTVSGNVGAGTGHVSVTTMSGTVTLLRRAPVGMESKTQ